MASSENVDTKDSSKEMEEQAPYKESKKVAFGDLLTTMVSEFKGHEAVPYEVVETFEIDGKKFEERKYVGGKKWLFNKTTTKIADAKKDENDMCFALYNYFSGNNSSKTKLPLTVPVSHLIKKIDDETVEKELWFYISSKFQDDPPKPNNPELHITTRPELTVYTRTIGGFMNEDKFDKELQDLDKLIDDKGLKVDKTYHYTNEYDAFKLWNRRNEVWRVKLQD